MAQLPSVCHLTSGHPRNDIRVFHKMCRSLARAGYRTTLIVADGAGDAEVEGVAVRDVGPRGGRWNRFTRVPSRILAAALRQDADIFHLHDPELLPVALRLKRRQRRVIFDSHEDVPSQLLDKPYLPPLLAGIVSRGFGAFEAYVARRLDGIIAATPHIADKFRRFAPLVEDVNNFPLRDELADDVPWSTKRREVCFVGAIAGIRGIRELIAALGSLSTDATLALCGEFSDAAASADVRTMAGWSRVRELGQLGRTEVRDVLAGSLAGLVTFLPLPNHVHAQPNKMFEYMSAGLPVIASDFPLWRQIVAGNDCGVLVDPRDPAEIAAAIDRLVTHPEEAARLGANGRKAVLERFNWEAEQPKLFAFYDRVLGGRAA